MVRAQRRAEPGTLAPSSHPPSHRRHLRTVAPLTHPEEPFLSSTIFHITSKAAWSAAKAAGSYTADSLATEGFIHCSTAEQFIWVANQRFVGRTDLVLLHIDPAKLGADVVYENLEGGAQRFPHVYGPIPVAAVILTSPLTPGPDGRFGA